ncbi:MAG TPA: DUF4232 domain-containing protein [Gaiellaceae bacterium]|nr:DUF4232 domain-containing protein [Gaiellaceae bacterium]
MTGRLVPLLLVLAFAFPASAATTVPRCHTAGLHVYLLHGGAAAGTYAGDLGFRNISSHACFVYGHPGLGLEDSRHRIKSSRVTWGSTVARRDPGAHRVVLAPGKAAFANFSYSDVLFGNERCGPSAWLEVTPPDEQTHRMLPFGGLVCNRGHLTVTALSARRTPHG